MRYLLVNHPIAVCVVLFGAFMLAARYALAPFIVAHGGHVGFVIALGAIFAVGFLMQRHGY